MLRWPISSSAPTPSSTTAAPWRRAPSAWRRGSCGPTRRSRACRPSRWRPTIAGIDLDAPLADSGAALDELERIYLRDAVYFHHPRYLAHLNCPVAIPALLAETILAPINSSLDTWDQSGGGTLIEQRLIAWTAARIGLGPDADGVFTSGGTQSNLQALHIARDELQARARAAARARVRGRPLQHRQGGAAAGPAGGGGDRRPLRRRDADAARRAARAARRLPGRGRAADGRRRHGRDDRLRQHRPARRDRRRLPRATASGCTSTPPTAAGCSSPAAARR